MGLPTGPGVGIGRTRVLNKTPLRSSRTGPTGSLRYATDNVGMHRVAGALTVRIVFRTLRAMYHIVGADQKAYGPVEAGQIRQWILEGRVNASTITRFAENPWKPLSTFPEFAEVLAQLPPPPPGAVPSSSASSWNQPSGPRNHPLAVTGLVLGCLALVPCCCLGPLFSVVAVVLCAIAITQINREPERWSGKNLATVGIVLALVSFAIFAGFWLFNGRFNFNAAPFPFR